MTKSKNDSLISHKELKKRLDYNPDTGIFTWLSLHRNKPQLIGKEAGSVSGSNGKVYRQVKIDGKVYQLSHLAVLYMTGDYPASDCITYLNGDTLDLSWSNIVLSSNSNKNMKASWKCKYGYLGIRPDRRGRRTRWTARYKGCHIGSFDTKREAIEARKQAELEDD
ncbi:TPA: hypothetical protein RSW61_001931 [Vibrio harveyi]|nr:hypothetical protein [Vibrio harveyi]